MNNTTQQKAGEAMSFTPRFPHFLHGGDYNPDQWLDRPDILERDVQLMQEAHVNAVSVGIFSWTLMEPEEGRYEFDWLDEIIDRLWRGGIHVVLATPSGARPVWMAKKYPEVLRVNDRTQRIYATLAEELQLKVALLDALPYGVIATQRGNTVFLQNFSGESRKVALSCKYKDLLTGTYCTGAVEMPVNSVMVLTK